ncbi:MAG: hypothetical protein HY435_01375 [Candidatus Liptonbacteria bacterium]|nr:hypothetical protein [Candidatus Liptonbacteria bacterium]
MRGMGVSLSFHEIAARTPPGILILGFSVILFLYLIAVLILGYHWHQFDLIPLRSEIKKMRRIFYTVSAMLLILMAFSLFLFAR